MKALAPVDDWAIVPAQFFAATYYRYAPGTGLEVLASRLEAVAGSRTWTNTHTAALPRRRTPKALDVWEDRDGKMFRFFRDVPASAKPDSAGRLRGLKKL